MTQREKFEKIVCEYLHSNLESLEWYFIYNGHKINSIHEFACDAFAQEIESGVIFGLDCEDDAKTFIHEFWWVFAEIYDDLGLTYNPFNELYNLIVSAYIYTSIKILEKEGFEVEKCYHEGYLKEFLEKLDK